MNEFKDLTRTRAKIKNALNLTDVQFAQLNRIKGIIPKIEALLFELGETQAEFRAYKNRKPHLKKGDKCSLSMCDPITGEHIRYFPSMSEAAKHFNSIPARLSEYFSEKLPECYGYKWKKVNNKKQCKTCNKILDEKEFPQNGISSTGRMCYKSNCKPCHAAKFRTIKR